MYHGWNRYGTIMALKFVATPRIACLDICIWACNWFRSGNFTTKNERNLQLHYGLYQHISLLQRILFFLLAGNEWGRKMGGLPGSLAVSLFFLFIQDFTFQMLIFLSTEDTLYPKFFSTINRQPHLEAGFRDLRGCITSKLPFPF